MKQLWRGYTTEYSPNDFLREYRNYARSLAEYMKQQDAHEALTYLLDLLHNSMNDGKSKTYHSVGPESSSQAWEQHKRHDDSIIWDLFGGQLKSSLICKNCGKKSTTFDHFTSLSLELPQISTTIYSVIDNFTKREKIEWNCPGCHHKSSPERQLNISRLPQVLILQLKRFTQSWVTGEHRKIESNITFPLENLNMSGYISDNYKSRNPVFLYNLYAVSKQRGSLVSGHYTDLVRRYKGWWNCNDSMVNLVVNPSTVPTDDAYLLFYFRKDLSDAFHT